MSGMSELKSVSAFRPNSSIVCNFPGEPNAEGCASTTIAAVIPAERNMVTFMAKVVGSELST